MTPLHPTATTPFGKFVGRREGDLNVFRGVRYAQAPSGSNRFRKPIEPRLSDATIDAGANGPTPPQLPSRLEYAMGPNPAEQGEDCLRLTIWSPAASADEKLPVMIWYHGGAFVSGAGSLSWYSGHKLAREGRIVVVSVNSRLGALGYARIKGISDGNLGLHDQLAALRWVSRCIGAFGGDAGNITIAGQSAGAFACLALSVMKQSKGLFRRAILQSGALGNTPESPDAAEARGKFLADTLTGGNLEALREAPLDKILAANAAIGKQFHRGPGDFSAPWAPCLDGELLTEPLLKSAEAGASAWCEMIIGYTREECTVFSAVDPGLKDLSRDALLGVLKNFFGDKAEAALREYEALRGKRHPATLLSDAMTDTRFIAPNVKLAAIQAKGGKRPYVYQFDWQSTKPELGANHCIELPFLFGELDAWANAPMFKGANLDDYNHIGGTMRAYWAAFVRNGNPNADELLKWPVYDDARNVMCFDRYIAPAADPAGCAWRTAFTM
jgi:para-nitrobenzyl esterase